MSNAAQRATAAPRKPRLEPKRLPVSYFDVVLVVLAAPVVFLLGAAATHARVVSRFRSRACQTVRLARSTEAGARARSTSRGSNRYSTGDRRRRPTRAGIVRSAANLVRERGVHGSGMREIVAHSGGSRGSLGRYFPGGKTQLVTEALDLVVAELSDEVEAALARAKTFPAAIGAVVEPWRRLLLEHDFALGCPMAATVVDAADNDDLRVHVNELLAQWHASVADLYTKFGAPPSAAADQSTVLLAAIEGALILARARRSTEPLDTVERYFATQPPRPARRRT